MCQRSKQLFNRLPESIKVEGAEIPIKWDFRASILFEEAAQASEDDPEEQVRLLMKAYFDETSAEVVYSLINNGYTNEFMAEVMNFYRCGKKSAPAGEKPRRPLYLFSHDADMIYSAFMQQYKIDLYTAPNLHWWKFRAMFSNLSDGCEIVRVMQIRGRELTPSMSAKERRELRKAKAAYALPDIRSDAQIEADFADSFSCMF